MKISLSLVSLCLMFLSFNISSEEKMEFKLYRDKGVLLFNTGKENNRFWVSIQAAAQGGGGMYAQITEDEFNQVWIGKKDVTDFYPLFNRSYNRQKEQAVKMAHGIDKAISLHQPNLGSNPNPVCQEGHFFPSLTCTNRTSTVRY